MKYFARNDLNSSLISYKVGAPTPTVDGTYLIDQNLNSVITHNNLPEH